MVYEATSLRDLEAYHDRHRDLTLVIQLKLGLGVTRGVACLHEAGIIHCDIKSKNILVFPHDHPDCAVVARIIDFDHAILHQDTPEWVTPPKGTATWNAPEQTDGRTPIRPRNPLVGHYPSSL